MHEAYGLRDIELQLQYVYSCGFVGYRKSLWHYMAPWLAIKTIQIAIFVQLNQTYWLIPFQQKIQSYS